MWESPPQPAPRVSQATGFWLNRTISFTEPLACKHCTRASLWASATVWNNSQIEIPLPSLSGSRCFCFSGELWLVPCSSQCCHRNLILLNTRELPHEVSVHCTLLWAERGSLVSNSCGLGSECKPCHPVSTTRCLGHVCPSSFLFYTEILQGWWSLWFSIFNFNDI